MGTGEENGNKIVGREDRVSLSWEKEGDRGNQTLLLRMGIRTEWELWYSLWLSLAILVVCVL